MSPSKSEFRLDYRVFGIKKGGAGDVARGSERDASHAVGACEEEVGVTPFLGVAENIQASIKEAKAYAEIPATFDAAFSTLMLHHSFNPAKVFESISKTLKKNGKAIILDLCQHRFEEFKTEMGDVHLGFRLDDVQKMAKAYFATVKIEKMSGICCSHSGRTAELFTASMQGTALKAVI